MTNTSALLEALRAVPGVSAADIESDERPEGAGTLRLQLEPGADEVAVATSVNRVLREQFGLAVDANRVQVVEESLPSGPSGEASGEGPDPLTAPITDVLDAQPEPPVAAAAEETVPTRPTLTAVPGYLGRTDDEDLAAEGDWLPEDADDVPSAPARPSPMLPPLPTGAAGGQADAGPAPAPRHPSTMRPGTASPGASVETVETVSSGMPADGVPGSESGAEDESAGVDLAAGRSPRILIARMQLVSAGLGVSTEVTLSWLGETFAGQSAAAATPTSVHRSVAQATLRAVEDVVGGRARFELEQLEVNQLGPDRAVVVVVSMLTKGGSERLTGVSVVREDVRQAVIRATLDALNRRLESLLHTA